MKTLITLFGFFAFVTLLAQSETRKLDNFSSVSVEQGIELLLEKGNETTAFIEVDNIDIEKVLTEISGNDLEIKLDKSWYETFKNIKVKVRVTFRELEALSASSAATIEIKDPIKAKDDFTIDVSSAGKISAVLTATQVEIDMSSAGSASLKVDAKEVEVSLSSSANLDIIGSTQLLNVKASSAGDYDGYELLADEAYVDVSSGGSVNLSVKKKIKGEASSGGSIRYKGNPSSEITDTSSGGSIRKM